MSAKLMFGCDPEVFTISDITKTIISPALLEEFSGLQYIEQDELEKHPVYLREKEFQWIMDGAAWELNLRRPFEKAGEMFDVIQESLVLLNNRVSSLTYNGGALSVSKKPVERIDPEEYLPLMGKNKVYQGFIFGCDPDEDAVDTHYHCKTLDVASHAYRYGGGHIHVSGSNYFEKYPRTAIRFLSMTVGNFVVVNSPYHEEDLMRVQTYGRPERYRPQVYKKDGSVTYGVEYRSPSNAWISMDKSTVEKLFDYVQLGVDLFEKSVVDNDDSLLKSYLVDTMKAITTHDVELSQQILNQLG